MRVADAKITDGSVAMKPTEKIKLPSSHAQLLVLGFAILCCSVFLSACRGPDPSIELLESELRWYEDQLYLLDRKLDECGRKLDSARRFNEALKQELDVNGDRGSASTGNRTGRGRSETDPEANLPNGPDDELDLPPIDYGSGGAVGETPSDDAGTSTPDQSPGQKDEPKIDPGFDDESPDSFFPDEISRNRSLESVGGVQQVVFNQRLTGGHQADKSPGDDGLYIVLEPQAADGRYVAVPGELTLEVYERQANRDGLKRLARWDFSADETAVAMKESLLGKGIHLQLPWPDAGPSSPNLILVAKYIDPDGRRLSAKRKIRITPRP